MQTIEVNKYTLKELEWAIAKYLREFRGTPISDRTFRRWRKALGIVPDRCGLYWQSDLDRLKEAVRRMSQGQNLQQIEQMWSNQNAS